MEKQNYDKGGSAGSKGVQFQVNLLTVFLLNALKKLTGWRLSTENNLAGKFDDVVLECPDGAVLLQAKHRENKKRITVEDLMSTNSKNDDFSLPKYFFSYQEIKDKFTLKNVIICTNADVNKKVSFLKTQRDPSDSMLHCENDNSLLYIYNNEKLPELKEKVNIYYQNNIKNKGIDESIITDENLKNFLEHLQFYFNYPSQINLENDIKQLLRKSSWHGEVSPLEIYNKVMDWFQQKNGEYLTEIHVKAIFSEIKRDKHFLLLERYNVSFQNNDFNCHDSKRIYHFIADEPCLLQESRIYNALHSKQNEILCIYPDNSIGDLKHLIDAFGIRSYVYLIIVWPKPQEEREIKIMCNKIGEILEKYKYKKVILLAEGHNKLFKQIKLGISNSITMVPPKFGDLLKKTQDRLLDEKEIIFQGNSFNLNKLFSSETFKDYDTVLSSEILERLVRNKKIKVGSELRLLEESIRHAYIHRYFVRNDEKREEGNIFAVTEKLILISDSAGTGKTTVLTKLAMVIKERNPNLWVIKIELSHYSKILKDLLRKNKRTVSLLELLNSQESTKLTNQFEKDVFSMKNKVVLLLDGIDEISPNYTELIINLLLDCRKAPNLAKILITTRPHLTQELKEKLQVESFVLQPFTQTDQIEFLTNYWTHNLKLDRSDREKCEQYAKALMNKMSSWTELSPWEGSQFTAIPLQVRMLAEIFQENKWEEAADWQGCKKFLDMHELEPKLPEKVNLARLYRMFLEKKQTVFVEKNNPTENVAAEQALNDKFDECLSYHRTFALKVILAKRECELFTCYKESSKTIIPYALNIGIIQEVDNELYFIHRTFAEYFVAECLLKALQSGNRNAKFQKFLIDEILRDSKFKIILRLFDSLLQDCVDQIPHDIFKNYQSLSYEISVYMNGFPLPSAVHYLADEGCVATLQLLFKCINFKVVKDKEVSVFKLIEKPTPNGQIQSSFRGNRLDILQFYVRHGGVNIKTANNCMPLHLAARNGHLEMVKFLLEQGSNVTNVLNVTNVRSQCRTPLGEAVAGGHLNTVKFLAEQVDIKEHVRQGGSELYEAITKNHVKIVTYLLERVLEEGGLECCLDTKYSMIPFAAAYLGKLNMLKDLVEKGLNVNCRIINGESLFFAAARGEQIETIKYLALTGADVNNKTFNNNTVLHAISKKSSFKGIVELLVELGINIDAKNQFGMTALYYAAEAGAFDMSELLIKSGADVNSKDRFDRSILNKAAINDHLEIVELLVKHGADINAKDTRGNTLLHLLAEQGQLDAVKCLAGFDVDVTLKNRDGRTALHVALSCSQLDVAKFLIECNSDLNSTDSLGQTVLHLAVSVNTRILAFKLCRLLGMDRNSFQYLRSNGHIANDNEHMLVHSVVSEHLDFVNYLVDCGANINARNSAGQTVLHLAVLHFQKNFNFSICCGQCFSVVKFLMERGAEINIDGSLEDSLVTLAKEIQRCDQYYSGTKLEDILYLPVFRLLLGQTLLGKKVNNTRRKGTRRIRFPTSKTRK